MNRLILVGATLLVLGLPAVSKGAEKPNVFSLPISNRTIQGEIALGGGELVKFTSLEGSLVTLEGPDVGSLAISGEILDEASSHVRFTVFEIQQFGQGLHGLKQIEQFEVRDKAPGAATQAGFQTITANRIEKSDKVSQAQIEAFRQATLDSVAGGASSAAPETSGLIPDIDGTCCVTCGSTTACACAVSMSCGSCCADQCCPGGGGKPKPQNQ